MITCTIKRNPKTATDAGLFGQFLVGDSGPIFRCGQLAHNYPPAGSYLCQWDPHTPNHPNGVYRMRGVPNNPNDEIHAGNWCGDVTKINLQTGAPYLSSVTGCTILGLGLGLVEGQMGVTKSGAAIDQFVKLMAMQDFMLNIIDTEDAGLPAAS